ncbi:hypothetical protein DF105_32400 [Burkholderia stagnalis]|nr:hypothetical protein DF117_32280 [Burkholderia stagnalis]RQY89967.1 hypothetical protein DF106_31900 [Burkholderia stagnalis]RQY97412.1 hypothetical protein DF105_32400 [Burkholderia stagnalis]
MRRAVILLRTGCADLIEAAGVLRRSPIWQAGYMHADRFDITNKKLAKGVGSIHARKAQPLAATRIPAASSLSSYIRHKTFDAPRYWD